MKFTLVLLTGPNNYQSSHTAIEFARAAIKKGHQIYRVFFAAEGVLHGSLLNTPPQDEVNLAHEWQQLIEQHNIDAVVCVSASLKQGILNPQESQRYQKPSHNLSDAMTLSGLGQLIDATVNCDRVITFGN